jgi:hypothetical protein
LLGEQAWTDVAVPKPYPKEFREDVVAVAQRREPEMTLQRIAADFGFIRRMRWPQLAEWLTTQSSSLSNWAMPELIEAAIRVAAFELATQTDQLLADRSTMVGTDWAMGIAARSHALVAEEGCAADLYVEAIERLGRTRLAAEVARAHLLYGERLLTLAN